MVVYLDVLFLLNFGVDFLILTAAGKLTQRRTFTVRHVLGTGFGAVYAVLMFMLDASLLYTVFAKAICSLLIVAVSFKNGSVRIFLKTAAAFYVVSFVFGGSVAAGLLAFGAGAVVKNGVVYFDFSVCFLALSIGVSFLLLLAVRKVLCAHRCHTARMTVSKNGKSASLIALFDSGNLLVDPASGAPVIVAEVAALKKIMPNDAMKCIMHGDVAEAVTERGEIAFRLIPYQGVSGQGVMAGFVPDSVTIHETSRERKIEKVVIGVTANNLSPDKSFQAIMGGMCYDKTSAV